MALTQSKPVFIDFPKDHGRKEADPLFAVGSFEGGLDAIPERRNLHRHNHFEIFFLYSGSGQVFADFNRYSFETPSLIFITPGQIHGWPELNAVKGFALFFSGQFFLDFGGNLHEIFSFSHFFSGQRSPVISLPIEGKSKIEVLFQEMLTEWQERQPCFFEKLISLLRILLIESSRVSVNVWDTAAKPSPLVKAFLLELEQHYRSKKLLSDFARLLKTSEDKLNEAVFDAFGICAKDKIIERRLLEAKRLLLDTDLDVAEIAYYLNFDDASNFTKFIKKHEGHLPKTLRSKLRSELDLK